MTKERAIKHLKLMQSGARNAIRFTKNDKEISEEERKEDIEIYQDQLEALEIAIKALEQQPSEDCVSREQVWFMITGGKYPDEDYEQFIDRLVKELEDLPPVTPTIPISDDCVSRQAVIKELNCEISGSIESDIDLSKYKREFQELANMILDAQTKSIQALPPVTPIHGTCKDCKNWKDSDGVYRRGIGAESKCPINIKEVYEGTFYCGDFLKGESDGN